jgi:hypothetical protein
MKRGRGLAVVMCGLELAACSSMPGFNAFQSKPTTTVLLIKSSPAGAEAQTSLGGTCRTPCTMAIGAANDFTVSFVRDGYVPQTVTVHATMSGGFMTAPSPRFDPESVFVTLEPVPQPEAPKKRQRPQPVAAAPKGQP